MAVYGSFLRQLWVGALNGRTWKAGLLVEAYEQDIDAENNWSQLQIYEINATGYTKGGISVALEVTYDPDTDSVQVSTVADQLSFGVLASADPVGALVVYAAMSSASSSPLLCVDVFTDSVAIDGSSEFIYTPPPEGLVTLSIL